MKLSDGEIREIFERIDGDQSNASQFVRAFARAVRLAPRADFMIMRPVTMVVIGKYNLGQYCERGPMESQRSHCTLCDDTGFRPVEGGSDRRVTRCECRLPKIAKPADSVGLAQTNATPDFKSAAAGDR